MSKYGSLIRIGRYFVKRVRPGSSGTVHKYPVPDECNAEHKDEKIHGDRPSGDLCNKCFKGE